MNEEMKTKEVKEKKQMSSGKKVLILFLVTLLGFGGYFGYDAFSKAQKAEEAKNDESYKVVTQKDESYDGFYTLTKLDENGENTWDGLVMYVEKDVVRLCAKYDYWTLEDMNRLWAKEKGLDINKVTFNPDVGFYMPGGIMSNVKTIFESGVNIHTRNKTQFGLVYLADYRADNKAPLNEKNGKLTYYELMQSCDLTAGYDEESQEVWLSKLLTNEKSIYKINYKLSHFTTQMDMNDNCPLNSGDWMIELNKEFGTNFPMNND